jgi:hypothetical protein
MKTKTLAILLIILAGLAAAGALIIHLNAPERSEGRLGARLLEQLPVNAIVSVTIKGPDEATSLEKKADHWVVANRFNYPADFSKIIDLVRKLKEAKIGRHFESSEDTLQRLSLKDPEDAQATQETRGIRIQLEGENETSLAAILLGRTRNSGAERRFPDGQYVMVGEDRTVYLIDSHFSSFDQEASAWLDKTLLEVPASDVQRISCRRADGKKTWYTLERPEKEKDIEPISFPGNSKVKRSALNRVANALSSLRMEDVVNPVSAPDLVKREIDTMFEYRLFNGMIYRVYLGTVCSEAEQCLLKLEVDYQGSSTAKKEKEAGEPAEKVESSPETAPEEYAIEAKQQNERLTPWVYLIPRWQHNAFITSRDQLLERPDESLSTNQG